MRPRIFVCWRNAHQSFDCEAVLVAATLDEGNCFFGRDTSLLFLKPGIDLNVKLRALALLLDLGGEGGCNFFAVHGFNHIEQSYGVGCLVGL
ncbi:hypothetical protein D3C80_592120 [compost metagenome]